MSMIRQFDLSFVLLTFSKNVCEMLNRLNSFFFVTFHRAIFQGVNLLAKYVNRKIRVAILFLAPGAKNPCYAPEHGSPCVSLIIRILHQSIPLLPTI